MLIDKDLRLSISGCFWLFYASKYNMSKECFVNRDAVRTSGDIAVITLPKYCTQYIIDGLYAKKCRLEQEFKEL